MAPTPTSVSCATPITDVNSSGAELPAAINVAPATSSESFSFSEMTSSAGTKKSSQTTAKPENINIEYFGKCKSCLKVIAF